MNPFAAPGELRSHLHLSSIDENAAFALLDQISGVIRLEAGVEVTVATDTIVIDGTWGQLIILPQQPVTELASVVVDDITLATTDYRWNKNGLLRRKATTVAMNDGSALAYSSWGGPEREVTVTYTHGWTDDTPQVLLAKQVCLDAAGRLWKNPTQVTAEVVGQWQQSGRATELLTEDEIRRLDPLRP